MEWFALLIPIIISVVLLVFFKHKTLWWEFFIPFGVSIILIVGLKLAAETALSLDVEFWGGWVVKSEYYEAWDEEVPCCHAKYRTEYRTVTNSDGSTSTESYEVFDGYEHLYDVDYHPPYWQILESNGETIKIESYQFTQLCNKFGNRYKIDMERDYHSIDGDKYETRWNGEDATIEPVTTAHRYENRVQNANSVFNFREITKDQIQAASLFEYPQIYENYKCVSIIGDGGKNQQEANKLLNIVNAKLGAKKKVRMMILVFKNKGIESGSLQESYWKRGNKNEIVLTIGVDNDYNINWAYVFSWTEAQSLAVEIRDYTLEQKDLDLVNIVNWVYPKIESQRNFVRRDFTTFNYLKAEIPTWQMFLIFIITIIINTGLSVWIVLNEYAERNTIYVARNFNRKGDKRW